MGSIQTDAGHPTTHPLAPLTSEEIRQSATLIRALYPAETKFIFKRVTLHEPAKELLAPYLDAEFSGQPRKSIDRRSFINYYIRNTDKFHEAIVNLTNGHVEHHARLGPHKHGNGDFVEVRNFEKAALADEGVRAEIAKLQLPEGTVIEVDPWIYGSDGVGDDERLYQCFMYMRHPSTPSHADSNYYASPLPISPVIEMRNYTVTRIDIMPTGSDHTVKPLGPHKVQPPNEYTPEHQTLRTDLKPLHVVQPEGASFKTAKMGETGETIEWQKWFLRVTFNAREGVVISDVRYDGRSLFYRLSLSEMSIPYGDPRSPFYRKSAFDLGDAGAGALANNLKLGCDCLGSIHYLDAILADSNGEPSREEAVVCVHEQDAGIGWKHTNYRTGRAVLARNRELVVQSIMTVSNYEYCVSFIFNQAGEIHYEVRATGILSTQPVDEGVRVPWGTVVHPGVLAAHHQHIFSLRIDPMLDGHANRLVYDEARAMPRDAFNPQGVGYATHRTLVERSAGLDARPGAARTFLLQNARAPPNPVNGEPVGYKLVIPPSQTMLARPDSLHHRRAEFADRALYVLRHRDGELYAAGRYTNQSRGGDGVRTWAARRDDVVDADIVVFAQFGMQHVPRAEDFPVMPCEVLRVGLKPVNFFARNPAVDVAPASQAFNRSVALAERHLRPAVEGTGGKGGDGCCNDNA